MRTIRVPREDQCALFLIALKRFFGDFNDAHLAKVLNTVEWVEYAAGEPVMHEGTHASHVFFVVSGRLRAAAQATTGHSRLLGEMGRGEAIGEIALITGTPRTATVIAIRPSLLVRLSRQAFEELVSDHPSIAVKLAGLIIERLHRAEAPKPLRSRPTSVALVSLAPLLDLRAIAEELARNFTAAVSTAVITSGIFEQRFSTEIQHGSRLENAELQLKVTRWLDDLEAEHGCLLLAGGRLEDAWTRCCIRHADEVLLFADPALDPEATVLQSDPVQRFRAECIAAKRLVFVHSRDSSVPRNTARWLDKADVVGHVHLRTGVGKDVARLARIVSRSAVGLVLSGGGARGFAHLGVYKALCESDTPIDFVAGTSMGAAVGAMIALEMPPDEALEDFRRIFTSRLALDFNLLPLVSILSGRRVKNQLTRIFSREDGQAIDIEDAWRNFFCIASSYSYAREVVLRRGALAKLVRASLSMPFFLPPIIHDSEVLLDGALMNNLPTEEMSSLEVGTVIAVDVGHLPFGAVHAEGLPPTWRLVLDLFSSSIRRRWRVPYLLDVLYNAPTLNAAARQLECARSADILIQPELGTMGTLEWAGIGRAVEAGYAAARSKLSALDGDATRRDSERFTRTRRESTAQESAVQG